MNLRALLPGIRTGDLAAAASVVHQTPAVLDLASPWAPTHQLASVLDGLVLEEVLGRDVHRPLTRAEAMRVPAVKRARNIICGTVAQVPLRRYRGSGLLPDGEQTWAGSTAGAVPAAHRHAWTADDLLFHGWSCWSRVNGVDGRPLLVDRIPWGRWSVDEAGRVMVENTDPTRDEPLGAHVLVDQRTVILIPGLAEGILADSSGTIRHAADLLRAASTAARHPHAYMYLKQTGGTPLKRRSDDPTEVTVENTLGDWRDARNNPEGGVGFVPLGLEPGELGAFSEHLLVEGRNAAAVEVARVTNLPADLLDAAGPSSFTYTNARDNDVRAIQYGVGLYLTPIQAVLSQDAVTPHGQTAEFDLSRWLQSPVPEAGSQPATPGPVSRETAPAALEVVR
jgi:hypothetical protein